MKELRFKLGERVFTGQLGSRIEKKALYGYSRRVAEKEGKPLSRGVLCPDGRMLRRDQISLLKVDPEGTPIEDVATELDGELADLKPSAFDQDNELQSVPLIRLTTFAVSDVYPLDDLEVDPGLYSTYFNYRKSIQPKEALLLKKSGGEAYLFAGTQKQTTFVGDNIAYSFFDADEEEEEGEDLDFNMF